MLSVGSNHDLSVKNSFHNSPSSSEEDIFGAFSSDAFDLGEHRSRDAIVRSAPAIISRMAAIFWIC